MNKSKFSLRPWLRDKFNLRLGAARESEIVEEIEKGAELSGDNLWVLLFAIFIASIGLNVNSTAVIIGAMLISPLMGPIIAAGFGLATFDIDLFKKAVANMGFAVGASLLTSAIYFWLSPLDQAQSELLARTSPSIWDVFIALFGGLAGMVGVTRKIKGNVIPGVAIATALMPPICTAGYGLGTGQMDFFIGALYLFFINAIFIAYGAIVVAKVMRFRRHAFPDPLVEKRVSRAVLLAILLTATPSVFGGLRIVKRSFLESRVQTFVNREIKSNDTQVISVEIGQEGDQPIITVVTVGVTLSDERRQQFAERLALYDLATARLVVKDFGGQNQQDLVALRSGILEDLYRRNELALKSKDEQIAILEAEVLRLKNQGMAKTIAHDDIAQEVAVQWPGVETLYLAYAYDASDISGKRPILLAALQSKSALSRKEEARLREWLRVRTKADQSKLVVEVRR